MTVHWIFNPPSKCDKCNIKTECRGVLPHAVSILPTEFDRRFEKIYHDLLQMTLKHLHEISSFAPCHSHWRNHRSSIHQESHASSFTKSCRWQEFMNPTTTKCQILVFGWPINDHHVVKWYIYMVWYLLGCSHCRWVNHMHYPCFQIVFWTLSRQWAVLYSCVLQRKFHVFHDDGCPHFAMEGSPKLSTMALITLSWGGHVGGHCGTRIGWIVTWGRVLGLGYAGVLLKWTNYEAGFLIIMMGQSILFLKWKVSYFLFNNSLTPYTDVCGYYNESR